MPWPVPLPAEISSRAAGVYSGIYEDFNPTDANTVAGANCRIVAMTAYDIYQYQSYLMGELFPDTTIDNIDHHASVWGLTRIPPQASVGSGTVTGAETTPVPSGIVATDSFGNAYVTTTAATVSGGTATVSIGAASAGAQGNLAAGTVLTLLSPVAGLNPQSITILGDGSFSGTSGTVVPSGLAMVDSAGNAYTTTTGGTLESGSLVVDFAAGSTGMTSLVVGDVLTLLSPVSGLSVQSLTVALPGLSGGAAQETDAALQARVLQRIRQRGRGGNTDDYTTWAEASSSSVAYVQVIPNYVGPGSVGLFVAGIGPSELSTAQVATVAAYVAGVRPVTAYMVVATAVTQTINGTVHLVPDTTANRLAAANGFASWIATSAEIGATAYLDDMAAAIKAAGGGAYSFDITVPAADVVLGPGTIAVAGVLSFV